MRRYLLFFILLLTGFIQAIAQNTAWDEKDEYVNGFARVFDGAKFSFINNKQSLISAYAFEDARNFHFHLAAVKKQNKWGFINEQGLTVFPFEYDIVFDFSDNVNIAAAGKRWWLIDIKGRKLKELDISVSYGFKNGTAIVNKDGRKGTLDKNGNIVFERVPTNYLKPTIPYSPSVIASICPPNLDFEFGNFTNWQCFIGQVDSVGTTNVVTMVPNTPVAPVAGRHTLRARNAAPLLDPFGLFPLNSPDGSQWTVKLGNTNVGAQAERIRYVVHVPINDSNFSFRYNYAVVLQDPGHTNWTQPRFTAKLFDSATNTYIPCATFEYISTAGLPGFAVSPVDPSVIYKPWSPVFISLRGYGGKTLYLDFTTADCVRRAHWGYAYVDVENTCGQVVQVNYNCTLPHITTLTGPPGFQFYNWWNQNFTTLLGTGQTVTLNPGPPPNSIVWCEMIPFANFGCTDTIPVQVNGIITAHFDATDTFGICAPHSFTFYNRNIPSSSATWDFGDGNTGTGDTVTHVFTLPGTYIVRLNVTELGGCTGVTTDTVRVVQPTGSFSYTGGSYCGPNTVIFTAASTYIDSFYWDFGDGNYLNTTLATVSHTYLQPGVYVPHLIMTSIHGCQISLPGPDTIRIEMLSPGYIYNVQNLCASTPVNFTDTSRSFFGLSTRQWDFGDGGTATGLSVSHTYILPGTYTVKLVITGVYGCTDSVFKNIPIIVHNIPASAITGPATACVNAPLNFNGTVISADAVNSMNWSCTNGATGTGNTFATTFTTAGTYTVQLISTTINGCKDTVTHSVLVNPLPTALISGPATICQNATPPLVTFTGAAGTAPYTFTYTVNGGPNLTVTSTSGNSVTVSAPTNVPGTFTYTLISVMDASSTNCSQPQVGAVIIKVNPLPTAFISGPLAVCQNGAPQTITFTGAGSIAPYTFTYSVNAGPNQTITTTTGNSVSLTQPTNIAGTFTYTLISVRDASSTSCSQLQSGSSVITINPLPNVQAGADKELCRGSSLQLNVTGAAQYNWSPATGLSCINCPNPLAGPVNNMQYIVQGTSSFGCIAQDTINLTVIQPFTMFSSPDDTICIGDGVLLSATGANSYMWTPATGLSATNIATPIATPTATTTYRVIGYDGHNCFSDTSFIKITVGPIPVVDAGADLHLASGDIVTLNAVTQNGPIIKWLWEPARDLSCTDCPSPKLTVHDDITYTVTVTNQYGCVAKDLINIFAFCKSSQIFIPNAFTPDGDGLNDILMVRGKGIRIVYFRVFSRWGELVFEQKDFAPNDPKYGWDGKIRGVPASPDVFVYTAEVICDNNMPYIFKGNTSLLK